MQLLHKLGADLQMYCTLSPIQSVYSYVCVVFTFSFLLRYLYIFPLKDIPLYESLECGTKWHVQNEFRVLVANTEGKRPVGRPMHGWKENFNFDIECEIALDMGFSWQGLWRMLFPYIMVEDEDSRFLQNWGNWIPNYCFTSQKTINFILSWCSVFSFTVSEPVLLKCHRMSN